MELTTRGEGLAGRLRAIRFRGESYVSNLGGWIEGIIPDGRPSNLGYFGGGKVRGARCVLEATPTCSESFRSSERVRRHSRSEVAQLCTVLGGRVASTLSCRPRGPQAVKTANAGHCPVTDEGRRRNNVQIRSDNIYVFSKYGTLRENSHPWAAEETTTCCRSRRACAARRSS